MVALKQDEYEARVGNKIPGESCPKCQVGLVMYDLRKGRWHGKGKDREYIGETTRSCLDCWHKW